MTHPARSASWLLLPLLAIAGTQARTDDNVTIYRCTDDGGGLTIGSTPCPHGQRQETRTMLRPKDAPATAAPITPAAPEPAPPARVVVINAPRPLYQCVRPDGSTYDSDSDDGDPRWVPLWTLGIPVAPRSFATRGDLGGPPSSGLSAPPSSSISIPSARNRPRPPVLPPRRPRPPHGQVFDHFGAGTWVRDECYALPQAEVCARLADRRDDLRRRFFNAQQRERDTLRVEERGLNARLANDCGVN